MTAASIKFRKQFIYPVQAYFYNRRFVCELIKEIRINIKNDLIKDNKDVVEYWGVIRKMPKSPLTIFDAENKVKKYFEGRGFIIKVIQPVQKISYCDMYDFEWEISLPD